MSDPPDTRSVESLPQNDPRALTADLLKTFRAAADSGAPISWREMNSAIERTRAPWWTPSALVIDFIRAYLAGRRARYVVDPVVTSPTLLLAVVDGDIGEQGLGLVGLVGFSLSAASFTDLGTEDRVSWRDGPRRPPFAGSELSVGMPELMVSAPPVNLFIERASYVVNGKTIELHDHANTHVVMTALYLGDEGEALFIVPPSFLTRRGGRQARSVLEQAGLHVHACVELVNAFRETGLPLNLLAIKKKPADQTWVGQLSPHVDAAQLAHNMRSRRVGRTAELGRLVAWNAYEGFGRLANAEHLERLLKKSGFPPVPLRELLRESPTWPKRAKDAATAITPTPNTVYLPTFLSATAHSDVNAEDAKPLKASGYVALPLKETEAIAEYVALLLNSSVGRALRAEASTGTTIPSLRRRRLDDMVLPLPGLDIQEKVLATRQRVHDLRSELDEIEQYLTDRPGEASRLERRLLRVGQHDPFKAWLETLPFPLASIAWRYRADAETRDKVDHLLRFFEATAAFFATVLLSAFDADEDLLRLERPRWGDKQGSLDLRRASFGSWTTLGFSLAGSARRLLSSSDREGALASQMRSALAVTGPDFLRLTTGKELWKVLDPLAKERNDDAHGGIKGGLERQAKLQRLEAALAKLRQMTADAMQEIRLVLPREGAYHKGINQYRKALDVSGYAEAFQSIAIESTQQLDAEELHLVDVSDEPVKGGLQLVPLVRLRPAPKTEERACYFYSRLEGREAVYVSHHFETESRIPLADPELLAFLERLGTPPA